MCAFLCNALTVLAKNSVLVSSLNKLLSLIKAWISYWPKLLLITSDKVPGSLSDSIIDTYEPRRKVNKFLELGAKYEMSLSTLSPLDWLSVSNLQAWTTKAFELCANRRRKRTTKKTLYKKNVGGRFFDYSNPLQRPNPAQSCKTSPLPRGNTRHVCLG